jgi:DNA (cytosine-5)-methyltransferase 1
MTHGSLFSGIGGFDLAAEWMGWENVFHCESNKFGQQVLKYYWPNSISYDDITKTDFTIHRGRIDILTGGFPCQPYSSAGKRLGKEDERHLWPQMLRTIREVQPRWVVGENVLGLVNWSGGLVFHEVQADLEAEGYEVQPYVLPAVSVNAPHRRDRVWFVAYTRHNSTRKAGNSTGNEREEFATIHTQRQSRECKAIFNSGLCNLQGNDTNTDCNGCDQSNIDNEINTSKGRINAFSNINESNGDGDVADTNLQRCNKSNSTSITNQQERQYSKKNTFDRQRCWQNFPTVSPICNGDDGLSDRLDSITFPKWRNESIKAGGNAIVPQVVYQIFKTIEQYEREHPTR